MVVRRISWLSLVVFVSFFARTDAILAAMSIDLGSQFMKIGLVKPGVPMEIVLNKESHRKTATLVYIRNGERLFGDAAMASAIKFPQFAFPHLIDLLGKKADNPIVELYQRRFPHHKIEPDENRGTVDFVLETGEKYNVETLLAMILAEARRLTEAYAEQTVKDAVISVPIYFNQAERRAVEDAAKIAGINLLQLINDCSAAGLNYGVFRRKDINETSQTLLIYDMGATKTTATLLEYRLEKEKHTNEKNPRVTTLGAGYDRTLGGLELSIRLRDYLVGEFRKTHKTTQDITTSPRALAKLLKEAERVKQVLSANVEHYAQVEGLHEEQDFKALVKREELLKLFADLEPRITRPIAEALAMAEMKMDQVDQIVLMGAGTRMPRVQHLVQEFFNQKELGRFLNTDEAIALGGVYQAAHLSKGFKVKKFGVHEIVLFPVQVDFERQSDKPVGEPDKERIVHRLIYGFKSTYPAKKMLTFAKHTRNFGFSINYGDLKHLSQGQLREFGALNITEVQLDGITDAFAANQGDGIQYKGVKAHFRMDGSGIVRLDGAEVVVEKAPKEEESTFSAIAGKISGLFGSDDSKTTTTTEETPPMTDEASSESKSPEADGSNAEEKDKSKIDPVPDIKKTEETTTEAPSEDATKKSADGDEKLKGSKEKVANDTKKASNDTKKEEPKPSTVKVQLKLAQTFRDIPTMPETESKASTKKLRGFEEAEKAKAEREMAQNILEALVYDLSDQLTQDSLTALSTETERTEIGKQLDEVRTWMDDEAGIATPTEEFTKRTKELKKAVKQLHFRRDEETERPKALATLKQLLNHTEGFLGSMRNLSTMGADMKILTEVELDTLEKLINTTQVWLTEKTEEQEKLGRHEPPTLLSADINEKSASLEREMRYLINKMTRSVPKIPKTKSSNTTATKSNATMNDTIETSTPPPDDTVIPEPETTTIETPTAEEGEEGEDKPHKPDDEL